jgi:thiol-disulfide isomerase/thioredoxin
MQIASGRCGRFVAGAVLAGCVAGFEAPKADLTLKDAEGRKVHLRDYRGSVVVVNFWATWCKPCNAEMPLLVEAQKQFAPRGVVFIAASLDDPKSKEQVPAFLTRYHAEFTVWYGASADDLDRLSMGPAVPGTAFVDSEGHIAARIEGQMWPGELQERLDWLTGGRQGAAPERLVRHLE